MKVYLALNTYPHDQHYDGLPDLVRFATQEADIDAVIVSDIGVLSLVRQISPQLPVHLSTQANTVSTYAVNAWAALGVNRVILARELSKEEIRLIRKNTDIELEIFIHGSVCISISGRCLISNYLCDRDSNQGQCTQPCRWDYALVEETRPGQYMPVEEEDGFTSLYNSKDLCLLPVFDQVMDLGLDGIKIEGRNKAPLYVATIVSAYKHARDEYMRDPAAFHVKPEWIEEIGKVSNRAYFTGFFTGRPDSMGINYGFKDYEQTHHLAAKVLGVEDGMTLLEARNPLIAGMELEWLAADGTRQSFILDGALSEGAPIERIRPSQVFAVKTPFVPVRANSFASPSARVTRSSRGRLDAGAPP